jgi:hypothetical protein
MITEKELALAFDHLTIEKTLDPELFAERLDFAYETLTEEDKPLSAGRILARVYANFLAD